MKVSVGVAAIIGSFISVSAAAQQQFSGVLCDNKVDVTVKPAPPGTDPKLAAFLGVWRDGKWDAGTCNGLAVTEIKDGKATVTYYFGRGVEVPQPGSFTKTDAVLSGKYLKFISARGSMVQYEPAANGTIKGWFDSMQTTTNLRRAQ
jgi:hypothetical protein